MDILADIEATFGAAVTEAEGVVAHVESYVTTTVTAAQGENDALRGKLANYEARLSALVAKLKSLVPVPAAPVEPHVVPPVILAALTGTEVHTGF